MMGLYNFVKDRARVQNLSMSWSIGEAQESFMLSGLTPDLSLGLSEAMAFVREFVEFRERLRIDYAQRAWQIRKDYLNRNHNRQAALANNLSRISPATIYEDVTAILAKTSLGDYEAFMEKTRRYRQELIEYLHSKDAFTSAQWFTTDSGTADVNDLPKFASQSATIADSLKRSLFDIALLLMLNALFFMGAYLSFLRSQP
jgi:hypothetical protein